MRIFPGFLVVSAMAVASIAGWEGYSHRVYQDAGGVPTIGFGTTRYPGVADASVAAGETTDPVRAVQHLAADANRIARDIAACIGDVPLAQHEFDAFVSLAYNIGAGAFCRSTLVRKLHKSPPDYSGACQEIKRWVYAAGMKLRGLERRRAHEHTICTEGY